MVIDYFRIAAGFEPAEGVAILTSSSPELLDRSPLKAMSANADFFQWSFGGRPGVSCLDARSDQFKIQLRPSLERRSYDFRQEVIEACKRLDQRREGKTIALCYSAGMDSEIIARTLAMLGIPFELYFLDLWGLNRERFEQCSGPLLAELGKKAHVVSLSKEHLYQEHISKVFPLTGCELPTYLALTYLFEHIPSGQFIVVGDGDLDRTARLYGEISKEHSLSGVGAFLPFSISRVAYYLWAQHNARAGEYYFYSSTPELMAAAFSDPHFELNYPHSSTRKMIAHAFPEVALRPKTTNWDSAAASMENRWVRARVRRVARDTGGLHFWRSGIGTVVNLEGIFYE